MVPQLKLTAAKLLKLLIAVSLWFHCQRVNNAEKIIHHDVFMIGQLPSFYCMIQAVTYAQSWQQNYPVFLTIKRCYLWYQRAYMHRFSRKAFLHRYAPVTYWAINIYSNMTDAFFGFAVFNSWAAISFWENIKQMFNFHYCQFRVCTSSSNPSSWKTTYHT